MVSEVVIKVIQGIVDPVTIPEDINLIVRDYDLPVIINDKDSIQLDEEGKQFVEIVFNSSDNQE